jgi:hypothetical protein
MVRDVSSSPLFFPIVGFRRDRPGLEVAELDMLKTAAGGCRARLARCQASPPVFGLIFQMHSLAFMIPGSGRAGERP